MDAFGSLNVWEKGGERAPHKPLLLLLALGHLYNGHEEPLLFSDIEAKLGALLEEFGPSRKSHHPEYPFWFLQSDGVWKVDADSPIEIKPGRYRPNKSELVAKKARGWFPPATLNLLRGKPQEIARVARGLLEGSFPASIHDDIASAVGLPPHGVADSPTKRDPKFRDRLLIAYEYRCAICDLDIRICSVTIGLDAAHIKWHQAGGPDQPSNGLVLCTLHHKLFDLGAFTVTKSLNVAVSERAHGGAMFNTVLLDYHSKPIRKPQRSEHLPAAEYLDWHFDQVFKKEARPPSLTP